MKDVLTITTSKGTELTLKPVPMKVMPSKDARIWLRFLTRHIPGTSLPDREQNRIQAFMKKHKTEALTDGERNITLAGGMLAICDPTVE